jgi:glycosyltransferase involved in cell wall biosynthesis
VFFYLNKKMKISIVTLTTTNKYTGVAHYLNNLITHLQKIDTENEYLIYTSRDNSSFFSLTKSNFKEVQLPFFQKSFLDRIIFHFWSFLILPLIVRLRQINKVHLPNTMFIPLFCSNCVVTVHDIVEQKTMKYGQARTWIRRVMINRILKKSIDVITISENTKRDLFELVNRNCTVIYNGYKELSFNTNQEYLEALGLFNKGYILFIGTLLPHKNIPFLIEQFSYYLSKSGSKMKLVLVGHRESGYELINRTIVKNGLQEAVLILDYVSESEKCTLLKNAYTFTYFSKYEGFGFPLLEAQDAGIPVITWNVSCLPEVVGAGAIILDNKSNNFSEDFLVAMDDLIKNREDLISAGKENLKRFDWSRNAEETLKIYMK